MASDVKHELQDLTHLDWSESTITSATGGSYLKARFGDGAQATYYKLSCYDEVNGVYGHECVNEIIAARLMDVLCIRHVPYRLVRARVRIDGNESETWIAESSSFRAPGESKASLARFYSWNHRDGEGRLAFCKRFGWFPDVQKMMLVDYLIANRDRHGANIEVLKARDATLRMAPLFDNGLSLCYSTYNAKTLNAIDPLQDVVAGNYLGAKSVEENLVRFVSADLPVGRLRFEHGAVVTDGLAPALDSAVNGVSGREFAAFLWNMIWERWCAYEGLRASGRLEAQG